MGSGNKPALGMIFFTLILVCVKQFYLIREESVFFAEIILGRKKTGGQIEGAGFKNSTVQYLL